MSDKLIGRWESRSGNHVVELWKAEGSGYYYRSAGASGYLGNDITEQSAIDLIEARCQPGAGFFQPDDNKLPLRRVEVPQ
jgi:hypothetical protein